MAPLRPADGQIRLAGSGVGTAQFIHSFAYVILPVCNSLMVAER